MNTDRSAALGCLFALPLALALWLVILVVAVVIVEALP